jgi:hypothetical protein
LLPSKRSSNSIILKTEGFNFSPTFCVYSYIQPIFNC